MIQKLNNSHTDVLVNNIYDPTNIIKFKKAEVYYFFSSMKMGRAIDKKTNKEINVVRFHFQRANNWEGLNKHDFKYGEKFTDRFEFVDFNSIPNSSERINIIHQIKKHNPDYKFSKNNNNKFQLSNPKFYGDKINSFMRRLKDTHRNGGRVHKAEEYKYQQQEKETMERWRNTDILESLEKIKSCDNMLSINTSEIKKPQTIILKKRTHKKNNKIVIDEPVELGLDMSPRYIGGVDCANESDQGITISNSPTTNIADYTVTRRYVADEINHMWWGIPSSYLSGSLNTSNNADIIVDIDTMKVLSIKDKIIDNKVCMLEDKSLIL